MSIATQIYPPTAIGHKVGQRRFKLLQSSKIYILLPFVGARNATLRPRSRCLTCDTSRPTPTRRCTAASATRHSRASRGWSFILNSILTKNYTRWFLRFNFWKMPFLFFYLLSALLVDKIIPPQNALICFKHQIFLPLSFNSPLILTLPPNPV